MGDAAEVDDGFVIDGPGDDAPSGEPALEPEGKQHAAPAAPEEGGEQRAPDAEGSQDDGKKPAAGAGEGEDPVSFDERQQGKVDQLMAEQTYKRKAVEEERDELQRRLAEYEAKQEQGGQEQTGRPEIPPMPDVFEDGYEEKLEARDKAIAEAAKWDQQQQLQEALDAQQHQQEVEQATEQYKGWAQEYADRAKDMNIPPAELQEAGDKLSKLDLNAHTVTHILRDEAGPNLTIWLSKHPETVDKINAMDPMSAARFIAEEVKPKANKRRTKTPPPAPADGAPRGSGASTDDGGPEGATYE